jgi:2-keto-3-deoxy-L-rhamnonate aldolase RhmA
MGFDFLWIEMEHSPVTLETLRHIVLATRGAKAVPFARVPVNEIWTAKRVLDAGVHGVIFPFTSTPGPAGGAARYRRTARIRRAWPLPPWPPAKFQQHGGGPDV